MKSIFLGLLLVIVSPQIKAQNNVSVPFFDGFIGVRGNNTQTADNIQNFSSLGIERVYFSQNSSGNIFEVQGNDIAGTITLVSSVTGQTLDVPGAIVWRITSGSTLEILGFIPAVGNPVANLSSIGLTSYQLDSDSNYGLKLVSSSFLLVDGTNISGNAASTGLLTALNNYLIEVQQNAPLGPVTVDDLTTTDSTPTISGTVNLASGEIFSVVVNGQTYDSANGVSIDGTNWMLTLPQTNLGTYSISTFITNTASFTLSAIGSLTIQDCQTVNDVPAPPISGGDISECETIAAQSLVATASVNTGESITWYDAATGGNLVADPSLSAPGTVTYFAEATNDTSGCVGQTRTAVTLTIEAAPSAPTGDSEQTFCDVATIADLTATGDNIQWYDSATGGNLLDSATALTDGQMVYASQTVNGCESTDRLEVSVSIQEITITASATEVCAGESVDLTLSSCTSADLPANLQTGLVGYWPFCGNANDETGNGNNGTVNGATLTTDRFGNQDNAYIFEINDSFINIGSDNLLQFSNDFSYSVKFLVNEITLGSDCSAGSNIILNNEGLYEIGVDCNGILSFAIANDDPSWGWIPITPILINQWYDVIFTYNQGVIKIFIDGDLIYNYNGSGGLTDFHPTLNDLRLGDRQLHDVLNVQTSSFNGKIDDVALWNRALTPSETQQITSYSTYTWSTGDTTETITVSPTETTEYWVDVTTNGVTCREYITINVTAPAAPIGPLTQAFCDVATVADLTATGDNIQWYDAATGGNLLNSTTALTDGQMVYASQTINGCESTDRLEVTVSIQDITITASATEVCAGESVDLSVFGDVNSIYLWSTGESNFSGQGTLVDEYSLVANTVSQNTFSIIPGNNYRLEVSGTINLGGGAGNQRDVAYYIQTGSGTIEGTPFASACNVYLWTSLFCDTPGLRPTPDIYDASTHTYNYPFTANASTLVVGFWDAPLGDNGANVVTFKLYELSNSESTITVTPTDTTEYWVDITTNGVTCREYITITVNDVPAPPISGGDITSCETLSAQNLVATASVNTGESITWYDAITGGNVVADPSLSTPGTVTYFAEATNDTSGCVGQARTAVTLTIEAAPDAPISGGDISECETIAAQSLVATALAEAGESITWYDAATGGNLVADPSLSTPGTVTYFAEATNDTSGCSSLSRTAVTLTITSVAAPTGEAVQSFCDNVTVSDLSANGTSLQWYDAPTGGNLLNSSYALSDGEMVYVSQTDNGCESVSRLEISVEIDVIPDPILLTTEIEFCIEAEVLLSDIEIDTQGFNLVWYDSYTFGTVLPSDTLLEDQVSYFAALVDPSSSCESLNRLEYVPSIIPCEVFIYNALSLNDNGLNDYMVIEGSEYFPENTLQIFNRDGHLVYEKDQYGTGDNLFRGIANVNGIYRSGSKMPTGSYLYVFRYFNPYQQKEFIKKGFLMINSN